jgi:serine/threonine protein kinase
VEIVVKTIGKYRVDRCLGAGTFAVVWLAIDPATGGEFAIKVLGDTWNRNEDIRQRFYREARILWHSKSDRVISIEEVGELPDTGQPYIVMEFASGGTLQTLLTEQRVMHRREIPLDDGFRLIRELTLCLIDVHASNTVHRDLKPENVLIQTEFLGVLPRQRLVLGDFGLAKHIEQNSVLSDFVGSPGYMAPEQWRRAGSIGPTADVYALGALAFEILTSQPAFPP